MGLNAGGKRTSKPLALLLALIAAMVLIPSLGNAQKAAKKLSKQDVIDLLTGDVSSDEVAQEARKSGIAFQVTASAEKEIRDAGGTDDLIRALRTLATPTASPPVTTAHNPPAASPPVLMIESSPGQAQVYVDDEPVGTTSQQGRLRLTKLAAGDHSVRISLNGYQEHEESVSLKAGEVTTLSAALHQPAAPPVNPPPLHPQTEVPPAVNSGQAGYLGVQAMTQQPAGARGVVISGTMPGGPADQAGLKTYDTILAVNGQPVTTPQELHSTLSSHQAGEVVQITWYNGSSNVTRQIRLVAPPAAGQATPQPSAPPTLTNMPHNGFATFRVAHDHGRNGQDYCVGVMSIGNGMIYYKADNGVHTFEIPLNTVKEYRRNAVYLVAYYAFHIHTKMGSKFNFASLNQQGQPDPPDAILTAITNAMGK
jgi:hypothetical protein